MLGFTPLSGAPISDAGSVAAPSEGIGTATGSATVTGIGAALAFALGAAVGLATVTGAGGAHAAGIGSCDGAATCSGVSGYGIAAIGSATGSATVVGVSGFSYIGVGAATGSATVSGISGATARSVGQSAGSSSVLGVSDGGAAAPATLVKVFGPNLMLYENLPLRTTRQLGDFAEDSVLAYVFGDLTAARFPLRRVSPTRGHAADHPMEITAAFTGNVETSSWEAKIEADATGHVCTFVDFLAPVADNETMSAAGRGKRNPVSGALIENPGEIMQYVAGIAGRSDLFQSLREECAKAGIRLAGRIGAVKSIRSWLDAVAQSCGAIWSPGMSRRYPVAAVSGSVIELDKMTAENVKARATVEDTADILRIAYDWCDATDRPQKHIELTANPQRYGGLATDLELPMLRSAANAVTVGGPILQRMAGERYGVTLDSSRFDIRPGQWIKLVAHPEWPFTGADPTIMVLAVSVNRASKSVAVSGEWQRTVPSVTVTGHTLALPDTSEGSLEVTERNGIATFVVRDAAGRGVPGARVAIDGAAPLTSNASGEVFFAYVAGHSYEINIEVVGMVPQTLTVSL